jgi:hypothetical protein
MSALAPRGGRTMSALAPRGGRTMSVLACAAAAR